MPTAPFRHLTVDVDGPVHLLDGGGPPDAPRPATVLVHGLDGSAANWVDVLAPFAARRRVVAVDLPGFGRTPLADRRVDLPGVADHLAAVLDRLDLGPVELVGNSWGGPVALWTAARHPGHVARVVLAAPALPRHARRPVDLLFAGGYLLPYAVPGLMRTEPARRHAQDPERRVRDLLDLCQAAGRRESDGAFAEMVEVARQRDRDDHVRAWTRASRSLFGWMARPAAFHGVADRVTAPVHVVEGGADPIVPAASLRRAGDRHPSWTHAVLPDVGHVPQLEDPAGFVAVVDDVPRHQVVS